MEQQWRKNAQNEFDDYRSFDSPLSSSSPSNKLYSVSSSPLPISSCSYSSSGGVGGNYIEHTVSRFDTLAGVAIKYGVEVSDVKKLNGLVSDLQMFALKTLYIPLPGRHPPSPIVTEESDAQRSRSSEQTPPCQRHSDLFDSLQSLKMQSPDQSISPAMHSLRGYYKLTSLEEKTDSEGCEMAVYRKGGSHYLEDGPFGEPQPSMNRPPSVHRKSKTIASDFRLGIVLSDDVMVPESDKCSGNLARRRLKSEADFNNYRVPEKLLKEDASSNGFSFVAGKSLALRTKAAFNRALSGANGETQRQNSVSTAVGDFSLIQNSGGVKRSYSTPNFQDTESSPSIWSTVNWGLKPDLQALSAATTIMPILDSLPNPLTGRRNKTAVD